MRFAGEFRGVRSNKRLVPTRNGEAPLLAAQRRRWATSGHSVAVSLAALLAVTACSNNPRSEMEELWVSYAEWPDPPKNSQESWSTPGIVVAFCRGGEFRMASGSLYRSADGSAALGASDGIAMFRGHWSGSPAGLDVTYWVESAEILPLDQDIVGKKRSTVARLALGSNALVFSYYRWLVEPGFIDIELVRAQSAPFAVSDRFAECRDKK